MDADSRLSRWQTRNEIPLFAGSLVFLGAYAAHVLGSGIAQLWHDLCLALIGAMWAYFAADYAVRWRLTGGGLPSYARHHVLDTVVLLLPLLRPLRMVPLYEALQRRRGEPRLGLYARVIAYAGVSAVLLGFAGALAVYQEERGAPGATIRTFGDAVWWTCSTLTTVGYGDVTPVTFGGRVIAVGIMTGGLALLGAVTGSFSSWLLQIFTLEGEEQPPAR